MNEILNKFLDLHKEMACLKCGILDLKTTQREGLESSKDTRACEGHLWTNSFLPLKMQDIGYLKIKK